MKKHKLIFGTFFLLIMAGNIDAASFDCGKAATEVEKIICGDQGLSQLDERLSKTYQEVLRSVHGTADLKREQTNWLREVRNLCTDGPCLEKAYRDRLAVLEKLLPVTIAGEESADASDGKAPAELKRLFGAGEELYDFRKADLNGDGLMDYVFVVIQPKENDDGCSDNEETKNCHTVL